MRTVDLTEEEAKETAYLGLLTAKKVIIFSLLALHLKFYLIG